MNGQIQYGSRATLTSEATPPGLLAFRHEVRSLPPTPTRDDLQRLQDKARELGLQEETIGEELNEIRACFEALDLADQIARGDLPTVVSLEPLPQGDACHFVTPVRFGRRRADQFGHLELTSGWLRFHGALDVSVVWAAIADVQRTGRDVIVSLDDSRRVLRFCCHALSEAARATVVARHLLQAARAPETPAPREAAIAPL